MVHQGRKCVSGFTEPTLKRRRESEMCLRHGGQRLQLDQEFRFVAPAATDQGSDRNAAALVEIKSPRHLHRHRHYRHHRRVHHRRLLHNNHQHPVTVALPLGELAQWPTTANNSPLFPSISTTELKESDVGRIMREPCEGCVISDMFSKFTDSHLQIHTSQSTLLHVACALPLGNWVKLLCAKGAKVNARNQYGQTPLHLILLGDVLKDRHHMADCLEHLLESGADVNAQDNEGDSPLLYLRAFLKKGLMCEATEVAKVLLQRGANPNLMNHQNRSLLTYSVSYLDDSVSLSRLLLNYGANVWPCSPSSFLGFDENTFHSLSFNWFLKSVIQLRRLENCSLTLKLLAQAMGESPKRMKSQVMCTFYRHVRCYRVLGPVFFQIKKCMMRYWSGPQPLKLLCCRTVRKSMGPRRVNWATAHLGLPKPLQKYVLME